MLMTHLSDEPSTAAAAQPVQVIRISARGVSKLDGASGLQKCLLNQLSLGMSDSGNAHREGKGVNDNGFDGHGWLKLVGVLLEVLVEGNGWVQSPFDSFKITAPLVNPTARLWCRSAGVLVKLR